MRRSGGAVRPKTSAGQCAVVAGQCAIHSSVLSSCSSSCSSSSGEGVLALCELLQLRLRHRCGATSGALEAEGAEVPVKDLAGHGLGEEVRGVLVAAHFIQGEVPAAEPLLHPQLADGKVSHSADAAAAADADCGR